MKIISAYSTADKCCAGSGERTANRLIAEGKAGFRSAPKGFVLTKTEDHSREESHLQEC